jgi:hypothetical protein
VESHPELFDGGVDWEGTFVEAAMPNLLSTLPPAILNYPDYVASGLSPNSTAARNILAAGYPPDLTTTQGGITISLWGLHYLQFWEVTMCQWQKRLDPPYNTYGAGLGNYVYVNRLSVSNVDASEHDLIPVMAWRGFVPAHGSRDARYATIARRSCSSRLATTWAIKGLHSPARAPCWKS